MISSYIVIMTERASLSHESKTVATLAATEKTGCWLGRERPPRESLCLVAQMGAAGTFSPLHPLRGLIETLKSKNSHEPDSSIHCHACTHLFPWRLWCESRETLQCLPPCQTERETQGLNFAPTHGEHIEKLLFIWAPAYKLPLPTFREPQLGTQIQQTAPSSLVVVLAGVA